MRAKEYDVLVMAVEQGVASMLRRADKHADDRLTDAQRDRIEANTNEVVGAICEWFDFEDVGSE